MNETNNIYESLKNRENFMMKFNDAPFDSGILNPGWAEPSYDKFFQRLVDTAELLNQSTVFPMTALQHDLDMLTGEIELETQRLSTGASSGLTSTETVPGKERKQLLAQPLQAKTIITDNFLEENIEKEGFMDTYLGMLTETMGPAFERFGIFADTSISTGAEATGYYTTDGILKQLKTISSNTNTEAKGLAHLVHQDNVGDGILDAIERYIDQDGNVKNATCVLPPQVYARLMIEIANSRETNLGDAVLQDGNMTKILGIEIKQDNILRNCRNGYDKMKFTDNEYAANGTQVSNMLYGFIGQPNNIVFGMMRNFETKNQWDIDVLGYKVAFLVKGDVKVLWDQDTLAIPFSMQNTPTVSSGSGSSPISEVNPETPSTTTVNISVNVNDGTDPIEDVDVTLTDTTDNTKKYTGKTGSAGGCTVSNVPVGTYTVTATCTGYTDYTGSENLTVTSETTSLSIEMTSS